CSQHMSKTGLPAPADLDRRIARWKASLDTDHLWPDSTAAQRMAAHDQIFRAAALVLDGRPATLSAGRGTEPHALGVAAFLSGTGPLLGWWIEQGRLSASAEASRLLAEHLAHNRRRLAHCTEQ